MTTTPFNSEENFNELVFENRNKEYGAYVIRRDYSNTVSRSMLFTFGSIFIIACAAFLFNKSNLIAAVVPLKAADTLISVLVDVTPHVDPPKDPTPPEKPAEATPPKTDVVSGVVTDKPSDDNIKPNTSATVTMGDPNAKVDSSEHNVPVIVVRKPETTSTPPPPAVIVDEMPELKDLSRIISANLNYPQIAKENGTEGTVYLSFVVEKDGSVTDVKVLRGVADGCTEEAARVVKALPKWKPGKNHGEPVRVLFNLPIKFRLQ